MQTVDDAVAELCRQHPGLRAEPDDKEDGHTLHDVVDAAGHKILRVVEPPGGFPVRVIHFHADPKVETEYRHHHAHDPNLLHPSKAHDEMKLTRREWKELDERQHHPEIDSAQCLLEVLDFLMAHPETKRGRDRAARRARRKKKA